MIINQFDLVHRIIQIRLVEQRVFLACDLYVIAEEKFVDGLCGVGHVDFSFEVGLLEEVGQGPAVVKMEAFVKVNCMQNRLSYWVISTRSTSEVLNFEVSIYGSDFLPS